MMNRGEIYMTQFEPSVGREYRECRPALVVQAAELDTSPLVTVIPLTSKTTKGYPSDVVVKKDGENRLWKDSLALTRFITSFDRSRFLNPDKTESKNGSGPRPIGMVESDVLKKIDASLKAHLGL